jgi:plasmid stability protein
MATLYVENVPDDLYEALRARAQDNRRSIAAEVVTLLREFVPTPEELARRREIVARLDKIRLSPSPGKGPFPTAEEMIREDRER